MAELHYSRGWPVLEFGSDGAIWGDNGEPFSESRECRYCGVAPDESGHDPCIASLPGVVSACCGHGLDPAEISREEAEAEVPYVGLADGPSLQGKEALDMMRELGGNPPDSVLPIRSFPLVDEAWVYDAPA